MSLSQKEHTLIRSAGIFIVATGAFLLLKPLSLPGGDSEEMALWAESAWFWYYVRAPLTFFIHQVFWRLMNPFGWSGFEAIGFLSCIAGGFYVLALTRISRSYIFLIFNLIAPYMLIFVWHVEIYSWVSMSLVWYIAAVHRFCKHDASIIAATFFVALAIAFHNLAFFYVPSLLFVLFSLTRENGKIRIISNPAIPKHQWIPMSLIFIVLFMSMIVIQIVARDFMCGMGVNSSRFCPIFTNRDPQHYFFTMFSIAHLRLYGYFLVRSSPLALPIIVILSPWYLRGRFYWFLGIMALCGYLWTFAWHPDMGTIDWDLFGNAAIPANILAGLLLRDLIMSLRKKKQSQTRMIYIR